MASGDNTNLNVSIEFDMRPFQRSLAVIESEAKKSAAKSGREFKKIRSGLEDACEKAQELGRTLDSLGLSGDQLAGIREEVEQTSAGVKRLNEELVRLSKTLQSLGQTSSFDAAGLGDKELIKLARNVVRFSALVGGDQVDIPTSLLEFAERLLVEIGDPKFTKVIGNASDQLEEFLAKAEEFKEKFRELTGVDFESVDLSDPAKIDAFVQGFPGDDRDIRESIQNIKSFQALAQTYREFLNRSVDEFAKASQGALGPIFGLGTGGGGGASGKLKEIGQLSQQWAEAMGRVAEALEPTLEAFCQIQEKARSIREDMESVPFLDGPTDLNRSFGDDSLFGGIGSDTLLGGAADDRLEDTLEQGRAARAELGRALPALRAETAALGTTGDKALDSLLGGLRAVAVEGAGVSETLKGVQAELRGLVFDEVLSPLIKEELGALGETGSAALDIVLQGLRDLTVEGQGFDSVLASISAKLQELAFDEVLLPFLKQGLGELFGLGAGVAGTAPRPSLAIGSGLLGVGADGSTPGGGGPLAGSGFSVGDPSTTGAFSPMLLQNSAAGLATAFDTLGLSAFGAGTGLDVTNFAGQGAGGTLANELTGSVLETALATGSQTAASGTLTAALASLTASAEAAALALRNVAASGGGGGGGSGGIGGFLGSLFGGGGGGGGFNPGVGPGGKGFLHFGGPRAGGGGIFPGSAFLVGERGPELIVPRVPSTVFSAGRTRQMLGGAGGSAPPVSLTQNITVMGRLTAAERADIRREIAVMSEVPVQRLRKDMRDGGPSVDLFRGR